MTLADHLALLCLPSTLVLNLHEFLARWAFGTLLVVCKQLGALLLFLVDVEEAVEIEEAILEGRPHVQLLKLVSHRGKILGNYTFHC